MSCEYCDKPNDWKPVPLIYAGPEFGCLYIEGRCLVLEVRKEASLFRAEKKRQMFPANFCPACGRRL